MAKAAVAGTPKPKPPREEGPKAVGLVGGAPPAGCKMEEVGRLLDRAPAMEVLLEW